jgi:hypothetical protein
MHRISAHNKFGKKCVVELQADHNSKYSQGFDQYEGVDTCEQDWRIPVLPQDVAEDS